MQRGFKFTELQDGERMVYGPVTFTQTANFSGGTGPAQSSVSRSSGRTVGVTNQRVIIEDLSSADKTKVYDVTDVQRVLIKRKQRRGVQNLDLNKIQTKSGQTVKLGIMGLPAQAETGLKEVFPDAEIAEDSKCFVATAAYGSALAPQVITLRRFRDARLRTHRLGRLVIAAYEHLSPPLADWISKRPLACAWVRRLVLEPFVRLVGRRAP
jgi:hypothetical protein